MDRATLQSLFDELIKIAATRQVKLMRQLAQSGQIGELQELAGALARTGTLKVSPQGTKIKHLGTGAEAVADLVAGAGGQRLAVETPLTVRKVYDKLGPLYSKEQIAEKMNYLRRIRNRTGTDPAAAGATDFAQLYGGIRKTPGGARYALTEYVPKFEPGAFADETAASLALRNPIRTKAHLERIGKPGIDPLSVRAKKQEPLLAELRDRGIPEDEARAMVEEMIPSAGNPQLVDLHSGNVAVLPSGAGKVLDFSAIPAHRIQTSNVATPRMQEKAQRALSLAPGEAFDPNNPKRSPEFLDRYMRRVQAENWRNWTGSHAPPSTMGPYGMGIESGPKSGRATPAIMAQLGA